MQCDEWWRRVTILAHVITMLIPRQVDEEGGKIIYIFENMVLNVSMLISSLS